MIIGLDAVRSGMDQRWRHWNTMKKTGRILFAMMWLLAVFATGCSQQPLSYGTINEAAAKGDLTDVKRHLKRGSALNAVDNNGNTPMMVAAENGRLEIIQYLAGKGADVDSKNRQGITPLRYAVEGNHLDVVRYLVGKGADVSATGDDGKTPLWFAIENDYQELFNGLANNRLPLPECAATLKAIYSDWHSASNALMQLINAERGRSDDAESGSILDRLQKQQSLFWTLEEFDSWSPDLIQMYGHDILGIIPSNSIFFKGTDSGQLVIAAYQQAASYPFICIDQNLLADNTYLNITRDLYGDTIYIPSLEDYNEAFRKYVEDVNAGRIQAGADIKIENGKVNVQGVGGVMAINGILAELIFKENKARHDFYVEEGHVMQWMYPYLQPAGLIMKLNPEPIDVTAEIVSEDRQYWDAYVARLSGNMAFARDKSAQKTYTQLRCAIAGIYEYRRIYDEAEYAYKQAIDLYPLNSDAYLRLAQMYMNIRRFDDAKKLIQGLLKLDPKNEGVKDFQARIEDVQKMVSRQMEIEKKQKGSGDLTADEALELASIYRASGMQSSYQQLTTRMLSDTNLPPTHILALAGFFAQDQRIDALIFALEQYTKRETGNLDVWLDLAAAYAYARRDSEAINASRKAIDLGGEEARDSIMKDKRFQPLTTNSEFKALFPQQGVHPATTAPQEQISI